MNVAAVVAMLAMVAIVGTATAKVDVYEGKGGVPLFETGSFGCGSTPPSSGVTAGQVKINVKDGLVKIGVKVVGHPSSETWTVWLLQQSSASGACDARNVGDLTTDASGKGELKGVGQLGCGRDQVWITVVDGGLLVSPVVQLEPVAEGICYN